MIYRTLDGDMLDAICHKHYGDVQQTVVVYEANPRLAELGPVFEKGVLITLPDLVPAPTRAPIRLW